MSILVHLRQFEGPLGLLLYLIRKEEMDIFDININEITRQYLEYIQLMREFDLEMAGDFVAMAATLIHIKSRMLLPRYDENGEEIAQEDPRKELVQKLLEYQKYQDISHRLYERPLVGRDIFVRGEAEDLEEEDDSVQIEESALFGLISAYRRALRSLQKGMHQVVAKTQSIASRIVEMKEKLVVGARVRLRDLLTAEAEPRFQMLITFLALLELGKMGYISLYQSEVYQDIFVETVRPIERDVISRVEEYDAKDATELANHLTEEPPAILPDDQAEEKILASLDQPESHEEQFDESVMAATDEEILAAELEIENPGEGEVNL